MLIITLLVLKKGIYVIFISIKIICLFSCSLILKYNYGGMLRTDKACRSQIQNL